MRLHIFPETISIKAQFKIAITSDYGMEYRGKFFKCNLFDSLSTSVAIGTSA